VTRVVNYPMVSSAWTSATQYYSAAKEKSSLVKYGCELVESNIEKGMKLVVEPVIQNEHVKRYSEPILTKVDEIGCKQLDKIENVSEKLVDTYSSSKQMIETKVTSITNDIKTTKHTIEDKVVPPVDNYLKHSVLSVPINATLNVTERVVDTILPADEKEKIVDLDQPEEKLEVGPVIRAGRMTKKYQKRALDKLQNLSLRSPAQIGSLKYTVDLIQYAATTLDSSAKLARDYVEETTQTTTKRIKEKTHEGVEDVKKQIHVLSSDALNHLHSAVESLKTHVPEPVVAIPTATYFVIKDKIANLTSHLENLKDLAHYSTVASQAATLLRESTNTINMVISKAEATLPPQVVNTVTSTINTALDLLHLHPKPAMITDTEMKEKKEETKEETTEPEDD